MAKAIADLRRARARRFCLKTKRGDGKKMTEQITILPLRPGPLQAGIFWVSGVSILFPLFAHIFFCI